MILRGDLINWAKSYQNRKYVDPLVRGPRQVQMMKKTGGGKSRLILMILRGDGLCAMMPVFTYNRNFNERLDLALYSPHVNFSYFTTARLEAFLALD